MESILPNIVGRAAFIVVITVLATLRLLFLLLTTHRTFIMSRFCSSSNFNSDQPTPFLSRNAYYY